MKKLLFVADLHYALKQFDWLVANAGDYDPVVIGGDLLDLGSALDVDVQIVVVEKYLRLIGQKTRLLVSSGNHDGDSRNEANESVAQWIHESKSAGLIVDGDTIQLDGTTVTVCPWWDGPVAKKEVEAMLAKQARKVSGKWIWIHHSPPAGSPVGWTGKKCGGDEELREWIQRFNPDMVLCGHIHNSPFCNGGAWVDRIGKSWVFNPGRQIGPCPTYIAVDLEAMSAEWISLEGISVRELATAES